MDIFQCNESLFFENDNAKIEISGLDSKIKSIFDKRNKTEIMGDTTYFFYLISDDKESVVVPSSLELEENSIITIRTKIGDFKLKVRVYDDYFTFELITKLPEKAFKAVVAHGKYNYDYNVKSNTGAIGIALTYWANPCFYPDGKDKETKAEIIRHLRDIYAKYALIIAPITEHKDIIKKVSLTIDKEHGIMSEIGGAWGRDSRLNFGNYIVQDEVTRESIRKSIDFFKMIGVDQIDFHKGSHGMYFRGKPTGSAGTFYQGDFKYVNFKDSADFKENVVDVLEANGMVAGLHTYSFYIDYDCESILSEPKYQKDLGVLESFTLECDIDESIGFVPAVEATDKVCKHYGFMDKTTPFILIDEEIIEFKNNDKGFEVVKRGAAGTKPVSHQKGSIIKHIEGYYHGIAPILGSELFFKIAQNIAKAYNEGGYKMIYLDALDGISKHCDPAHEIWYYTATFVHEVIKNCNTYPLIEYATINPSIWPARGRIGAYDHPTRAYKAWNNRHAVENIAFTDRYSAASLGWYAFYPEDDRYPGNEHMKYHHSDITEHIGSLAVMYDHSMAFIGMNQDQYLHSAGLRRNIEIYKKYDGLRKTQYFSEEVLQKLRNGKWEYHLKEKENGECVFAEKDYQIKKLYDLSDESRNLGEFNNPFLPQSPFIRIEALLSSKGNAPFTMLKLDRDTELSKQCTYHSFDKGTDFTDKLARVVSICGNGEKGSTIAIKITCETSGEPGYLIYVVDTDFEGWRDFVLLESDNGDRPDLPFEADEHRYSVYRSEFNHDKVLSVSVKSSGETSGIMMSDIVAAEYCYEVLKNPTLQIGDEIITFDCELMSTDYIEYDGKTAKVFDRYGNEKTIAFHGKINAPSGVFDARLTCDPLNKAVPRAQITIGFTGKDIESAND